MADRRLRQLERDQALTPEGRLRVLHQRVRTGLLDPWRLELAQRLLDHAKGLPEITDEECEAGVHALGMEEWEWGEGEHSFEEAKRNQAKSLVSMRWGNLVSSAREGDHVAVWRWVRAWVERARNSVARRHRDHFDEQLETVLDYTRESQRPCRHKQAPPFVMSPIPAPVNWDSPSPTSVAFWALQEAARTRPLYHLADPDLAARLRRNYIPGDWAAPLLTLVNAAETAVFAAQVCLSPDRGWYWSHWSGTTPQEQQELVSTLVDELTREEGA